MKFFQTIALTLFTLAGSVAMAADTAHEFSLKSIDGEKVSLEKYEGKVLLIVNVASRCGLTPQYEQLQAMHQKYAGKGLVVIGVPCNQFGGQEPGSEADIKQFCSSKYSVTFPMMSKIEVNGKGEDPLYSWLKSQTDKKSDISWNFEKFVVGKDGKVVGRFSPRVKPDAEEVVKAIDAALK
jgi:glutathione peroxidase